MEVSLVFTVEKAKVIGQLQSVAAPFRRDSKRLPAWTCPAVIAAFWLLSLAIVSPSGNFPLNDDWIYAEGVKHFLETGELRLLACAPACVLHLLTGAAACKIIGFSHVVLRCLGVAWAFIACLALYGCFRELRLRRSVSLLFALIFAANPLVLNLAFSFMTDLPAIGCFTAYVYFALCGIRRNSKNSFLLSSCCLICAVAMRQNLAMFAVANAIVLLSFWLRKRHSWILLVGLVILPVVAGVTVDKWMVASNDFADLYLYHKKMLTHALYEIVHAPGRIAMPIGQIIGELFSYFGIFSLPLMPGLFELIAKLGVRTAKTWISPIHFVISAAIMSFSTCKYVFVDHRLMPFNQNLLRMPAVGAHTIMGINHAVLSDKLRGWLTALAGISGFVISVLFADFIQRSVCLAGKELSKRKQLSQPDLGVTSRQFSRTTMALFIGVLFCIQFSFVILQATYADMDRYYLPPFVTTLLFLAMSWRWHRLKPRFLVSIPVLLLVSFYSIAACQDYLGWNRVRWQAAEKLETAGVKPASIDGGAEYNYYLNPQLYKKIVFHPGWYEFVHRGDPPRDQWRWWTVDSEDYVISFSTIPDYELIDKQTYWSLLSANERTVYVLRHVK